MNRTRDLMVRVPGGRGSRRATRVARLSGFQGTREQIKSSGFPRSCTRGRGAGGEGALGTLDFPSPPAPPPGVPRGGEIDSGIVSLHFASRRKDERSETASSSHAVIDPLRRGMVSVWAIVCLVLVIALSVTMGRVAILGSRQVIQERRRAQADWLVQSGWLLARSRLAGDANYSGETWQVSAAELGGIDPGRVTIVVSKPDADGPHQVRIVAEYPMESIHKVQVTRSGTWQKQ